MKEKHDYIDISQFTTSSTGLRPHNQTFGSGTHCADLRSSPRDQSHGFHYTWSKGKDGLFEVEVDDGWLRWNRGFFFFQKSSLSFFPSLLNLLLNIRIVYIGIYAP